MPVEIRTRTAPPARGAPGEIDALFVASADTGLPDGEVHQVRSINEYELAGATRIADTETYDGLDNYFREGGNRAYVAPRGAGTLEEGFGLFTEELGGGQVVDWTAAQTVADQAVLLDHAAANKRFALLDVPLAAASVAEMETAGSTIPTDNNEHGAMFGPWVDVPAPLGVSGGSTRTVPASSSVAALISRSDSFGNPNRAPAGRDFPLQYAQGFVSPSLSDADTATLREAGVNPLRTKFGRMVLDGFQTAIDTDPDNPYWQANCSRARMWLQWNATDVGLRYEYKPIDGRGRLARALQTDLEAMCKGLWEVDGLFGDSPQEAYAVEVGVSVNNENTIAYGELHAVVEVRFSLHARTVIIELVTIPITGRVSA